ncbi:hypothetical protein ACVXHA_16290 [Escherichia coli]
MLVIWAGQQRLFRLPVRQYLGKPPTRINVSPNQRCRIKHRSLSNRPICTPANVALLLPSLLQSSTDIPL